MIKPPPTPEDIGYAVAANFGGSPELARAVAAMAHATRIAALEEAAQTAEQHQMARPWEVDTVEKDIAAKIRTLKGE